MALVLRGALNLVGLRRISVDNHAVLEGTHLKFMIVPKRQPAENVLRLGRIVSWQTSRDSTGRIKVQVHYVGVFGDTGRRMNKDDQEFALTGCVHLQPAHQSGDVDLRST